MKKLRSSFLSLGIVMGSLGCQTVNNSEVVNYGIEKSNEATTKKLQIAINQQILSCVEEVEISPSVFSDVDNNNDLSDHVMSISGCKTLDQNMLVEILIAEHTSRKIGLEFLYELDRLDNFSGADKAKIGEGIRLLMVDLPEKDITDEDLVKHFINNYSHAGKVVGDPWNLIRVGADDKYGVDNRTLIRFEGWWLMREYNVFLVLLNSSDLNYKVLFEYAMSVALDDNFEEIREDVFKNMSEVISKKINDEDWVIENFDELVFFISEYKDFDYDFVSRMKVQITKTVAQKIKAKEALVFYECGGKSYVDLNNVSLVNELYGKLIEMDYDLSSEEPNKDGSLPPSKFEGEYEEFRKYTNDMFQINNIESYCLDDKSYKVKDLNNDQLESLKEKAVSEVKIEIESFVDGKSELDSLIGTIVEWSKDGENFKNEDLLKQGIKRYLEENHNNLNLEEYNIVLNIAQEFQIRLGHEFIGYAEAYFEDNNNYDYMSNFSHVLNMLSAVTDEKTYRIIEQNMIAEYFIRVRKLREKSKHIDESFQKVRESILENPINYYK